MHIKDNTQHDSQIRNLNSVVEDEVVPDYHIDLDPDLYENDGMEADTSDSDANEAPKSQRTFAALNIKVRN